MITPRIGVQSTKYIQFRVKYRCTVVVVIAVMMKKRKFCETLPLPFCKAIPLRYLAVIRRYCIHVVAYSTQAADLPTWKGVLMSFPLICFYVITASRITYTFNIFGDKQLPTNSLCTEAIQYICHWC